MVLPKPTPKLKGRLETALSFLLPSLLLLGAYALLGVYPFGEKSLLLVDMNNEYMDYYAYLNRAVREGGSLLRSWEMGMGLNMLGLIAFYTSSAWNLLVLLAPVELLTEAVLVMTLLKVGFCGFTFRLYGRRCFPEAPSAPLVALSAAYGLCGYNLAYSSNIMWLDGVAFLPLVILGVERILSRNRYGLFAACLVYVFLSSYYIGYMIGCFSFLYLTARYFNTENSLKRFLSIFWRFLLAAGVAAGCCAFLLLPAFLGLKNGQDGGLWNIGVSWALRISLSQLGAKLLPGVYDSITDAGLPNIYVSVAGVLGALFYFCAAPSPRREKWILGGLLGVMLLSFSCDILNLAWHAFEVPTWFPARYSFLVSFLLLSLAVRAATAGRRLRPAGIVAGAALLLLLFVEVAASRYRFVTAKQVVIGLALALIYTALALAARRGFRPRLLAGALVLLVAAELGYNAHGMVTGMDKQFEYKTRDSYYSHREQFLPAVDWADSREGVARVEVVRQRNANGGMALGYPGISHYSTTTDQALNGLLRRLGYNTGTINELRFAPSTPLTNGLLGIRWVLSAEAPGAGYTLAQELNGVGVYENAAAFPLAFYAPASALEADGSGTNPFLLQNELLEGLGLVGNAFSPLRVSGEELENLERTDKDGVITYTRLNPQKDGSITFLLENPGQREAYAYFPVWNRKFGKATAYANGREGQRVFAYRNNSIIALGNKKRLELRLDVTSDAVKLEDMYFYGLDMAAATEAAAQAQGRALSITRFQDTRVEGYLTAPDSGALVTTFPADPGWTVLVDGKKVPQERFAGVFLGIRLTGGEHQISFRYSSPGFRAGCVISVLSVLLGPVLLYLQKKPVRRRGPSPV